MSNEMTRKEMTAKQDMRITESLLTLHSLAGQQEKNQSEPFLNQRTHITLTLIFPRSHSLKTMASS